jgi:hypothetical protein
MQNSKLIPRRTFLRGAGGVLLGLPLLEAMGKVLPTASPKALAPMQAVPEVQAPVRMACLYFPNGVWEKTWFPENPGTDFDLPFALEPLAAHKKDLLVFSGLDKAHSHMGDGHYAKTGNFLTGLTVKKTPGKDINVGGTSLDQLCAQKLGQFTPLPSLELGVDPVISGIDTAVGYTRLYGCYISWRSAGMPVAREINPRLAYERLFGVIQASRDARRSSPNKKEHKTPTQQAVRDARQSDDNRALLDLVLDDARRLRDQLGRDDKFKLDEYLESVRDVERRLEFFSHPDPRPWHPELPDHFDIASPKGAPGDHQQHVRLMLDLIALAFQTDSTRIGTFMFANDVSPKNFAQLIPGTSGSHHEFSHHQNKAEKYEPYSKINRWHAEQLSYLLAKLASIREGERTLLDNSMILFGSSFSDGNRHDPANLPIILAGRGGGKINSGRYIPCRKDTPLCNLYVSMLERMGAPVETFGDSTEKLDLG